MSANQKIILAIFIVYLALNAAGLPWDIHPCCMHVE